MSLPEFKELDLEGEIISLLTWHKFDHEEFGRLRRKSGYDNNQLPLGTVLKDANGSLWLVGNAFGNAEDQGCGCCSHPIKFVEIAFLSDVRLDALAVGT